MSRMDGFTIAHKLQTLYYIFFKLKITFRHESDLNFKKSSLLARTLFTAI